MIDEREKDVDEYDELFEQYVDALREAKGDADAWWERMLEAEERKGGGGPADAAEQLRRRWPLGPAAHPRVVAVYRDYYLQCEALTERLQETEDPDTRLVPPESFVTEWLLRPETTELALMIAQLPYAPIGMDEEGNTV